MSQILSHVTFEVVENDRFLHAENCDHLVQALWFDLCAYNDVGWQHVYKDTCKTWLLARAKYHSIYEVTCRKKTLMETCS